MEVVETTAIFLSPTHSLQPVCCFTHFTVSLLDSKLVNIMETVNKSHLSNFWSGVKMVTIQEF